MCMTPERQSITFFVGDGSLGFHLMEFETAVRHKLPVTVVVMNDSSWGIEEHFQRHMFQRNTGTALTHSRYELMAQALGGIGFYVDDLADLKPALDKALSSGRPAIVNVRTENVEHRNVEMMGRKLKEQRDHYLR